MARAVWERRRVSKPRLISFADFDAEAKTLPLVSWVRHSDWRPCKESVRKQLGFYDDRVEERIGNSIEIEGPEDEELLLPGMWVLCWWRTNSGLPDRRTKPWWVCLGPLVRKAFIYAGERRRRDTVLQAEQSPPEPFDATDPLFLQALRGVLDQSEYFELRRDDYKGAWFKPREKLMRSLWRHLKTRYCELAGEAKNP